MELSPRIKTKKNHGVHVCHDTSLRKRWRGKDGCMHESHHDCWRADISGIDTSGAYRIRRRFNTREEAMAFLHQFR